MIQINRKISLEPFKSRLPGIIPAIMNNTLYTFGYALIARQNAYPSNYGMCPCSIVIPNDKEWSKAIYKSQSIYNNWDENSNWDYKGKDEDNDKMIVSYRRLVTWYHFFENYYHLLMDYGSCGKIYTSAVQYYDCETQGNSTGNLYYKGDRAFYEELDKKFYNLGGKVEKEYNIDECGEKYLINLTDNGFYNWICTNCIPRFIIPKQYRDEWNATHIFYPDAIKWVGWFANRINIYKDYKSANDCKNASNCCDCEKFFKLGGIEIYDLLRSFVKNTRSIANDWKDWKTPNERNTSDDTSDNTHSGLTYIKDASTIKTQVSLQINVDDMGEMSPMEEEWKGGIDYGNGKVSGGTIVRYNDTVYKLNSIDKKDLVEINGRLQYGYKFDEKYLEYKFGNEDANRYKNDRFEPDSNKHWLDYTDYYISANTSDSTKDFNEFQPSKDSYIFSFNENGQKVKLSGYTESEEKNKEISIANNKAISISYNIERNGDLGYILIDGTPYEIFDKQEYITYQSNGKNPYLDGRIFLVERDPITNVPYVVINKTTYVSKDGKTFPFYKPDTSTSDVHFPLGKFIYYKDTLYKVNEENKKPINVIIGYDNYGYEYPYIDGYITYNNETYYVKGDTLYTSSTIFSSGATTTDATSENTSQESDSSKKRYESYVITDLKEVNNQDWGYIVNINKDKEKYVVNIYPKNYTTYNANYIEGKTESKLLDLQSSERTYDDLGNPLDGYYNLGKQNYAQPPEGEILEPLYQVGTVKNLTPIDSISNGNVNYFCGDILYKMVFYYVDDDGNKVIFYDIDDDGNKKNKYAIDWSKEIDKAESERKTTLKTIEGCKEEKEDIQKKYNKKYNATITSDKRDEDELKELVKTYQSFQDDIRCDITYYMGATLEYVEGKGYKLAEGYNKGVEYNETVVFKYKPQKYYLKEDDFYMINVIVPEREVNTIYSNTYGLQYNDNLASIKMKIDILGDNDKEFKPEKGFAHNNNTIIEPVIRQEYKFGISSLQSVDSDIYIDRGINAAFEKHLKLGEVSTMEELTQYSNGFFKILNT